MPVVEADAGELGPPPEIRFPDNVHIHLRNKEMSLTNEDLRELRSSEQYQEAFSVALKIHRKEHEPEAQHFRGCKECKSGFALLLMSNLKRSQGLTS